MRRRRQYPSLMGSLASFGASRQPTQNFTADLFASCFFVVKNSIGSSQYDDPELNWWKKVNDMIWFRHTCSYEAYQTRRKKTANPVFDIRVREIITGAAEKRKKFETYILLDANMNPW